MPFITKLDYSDNRQIKQFQLTDTQLSGSTEFGVPFSALTGVLDSALITTSTLTGITSTFSGNTTTTNISFGDPRMVSGSITLSVITDVTSGDTQQGYGFDGVGPYEIDGNTVYSGYTGSTYDFSVTSIEEVATDQWTGETISNTLSILSGATDDYTGRTIWVDVLGITKTRRLILDDEPDVYSGATHVLTRGLSGDVVNYPLSGITAHTGNDYTISASLTGETLEFTRLSGATYSVELTNFENSGLERIDEGNGDGWRLIDRDPTYYGDIGQTAIDFSLSTVSGSTTMGSTGFGAVTFGLNNINPYVETLMIGRYIEGSPTNNYSGSNIIASENFDGSPTNFYNNIYNSIFGVFTSTIGTSGATLSESVIYQSLGMGQNINMYAGRNSGMIGRALLGGAASCTIVGAHNVDLTANNGTANASSDYSYNPRFIVGNGNGTIRSNAFVVMSDGTASFPSLSIAEINASGGDSAITKEYLTGSTSGFTGSGDDYTTSASLTGETLEFTRLSGGTYSVELTGFTNSGLEAINEGGNDGWRLIGRDPVYYGDIGEQAVDFTYHVVPSSTAGVTGDFSVGWGYDITVSGNSSGVGGTGNNIGTPNTFAWGEDLTSTSGTGLAIFGDSNAVDGNFNVVGGQNNTISGTSSHCAIFGLNNIILGSSDIGFILGSDGIISGEGAFVIGDNNEGAGVYSFAQGFNNTPSAIYEANFGMWGTEYTPAIDGTDRAFNVGNGTGDGARSNSFTILKGGNVIAPSLTTAMITTGDSKTLITKEYLTGATSGFTTGSTTNTDDYLTGATFNTSTGDLTLTLFSGSTVIENLDGRYSLTGHTHPEFIGDYLPLSGGTLTGPVTGTTFNVDKSQLDYQENLVVDSATTETIATVSVLEHKAVFFDYVVSEGTNIRAGTVMTTFMSSTTSFTDTSTTDIGDTSGVTFSTDISGSDLRLLADTTTDGWEIKVMIRAL